MDDKNDIQESADSFGSVITKAEDKIVTDDRNHTFDIRALLKLVEIQNSS
jgi:hypothetical protein